MRFSPLANKKKIIINIHLFLVEIILLQCLFLILLILCFWFRSVIICLKEKLRLSYLTTMYEINFRLRKI